MQVDGNPETLERMVREQDVDADRTPGDRTSEAGDGPAAPTGGADALFGSDQVIIREMNRDGELVEVDRQDLAKAHKALIDKPGEGAGIGKHRHDPERAAREAADKESADGGKADDADGTAAETGDADAEAGRSRRRMRKDRRYRALEAEVHSLRAQMEARNRPANAADPAIDYTQMPKADAYDTDEAHQAAVRTWFEEQRVNGRRAVEAAHADRDNEAASAGVLARQQANQQAFNDELQAREIPAERMDELRGKHRAIRSRFARQGGQPKPMSTYFLDCRDFHERTGALAEDAKGSAEVFGDLFENPAAAETLENLTDRAELLKGIAALDDPVPVVVHLGTAEGKGDLQSLEDLAIRNPEALPMRLYRMAGGRLNSSAQAERETAEAGPETSRTPAPGNSPRAASRASRETRQPGSDAEMMAELEKAVWQPDTFAEHYGSIRF